MPNTVQSPGVTSIDLENQNPSARAEVYKWKENFLGAFIHTRLTIQTKQRRKKTERHHTRRRNPGGSTNFKTTLLLLSQPNHLQRLSPQLVLSLLIERPSGVALVSRTHRISPLERPLRLTIAQI